MSDSLKNPRPTGLAIPGSAAASNASTTANNPTLTNTETRKKTSDGVFSPGYAGLSIGIYTAITACAFDGMAVTAVMPRITRSLGDSSAYAAAFVLPLAMSLVAMVIAGIFSDVRGGRECLLGGLVVFCFGIILSIIAPSISIFLLSRAVQGVGIGLLIVALYAVIAQAYPPRIRTAVFAGFAAAWLVPSLVGPSIAGIITETFSWHWVFVLTLVMIFIGAVLCIKPLLALEEIRAPWPRNTPLRIGAALIISAAATVMTLATKLANTTLSVALFVVALIVSVVAVRPLIPKGTLKARNGVPRLIATRGVLDMAVVGQVYIPLYLADIHHVGPTLTGAGLTMAGLTWWIGSQIQAHRAAISTTPAAARVAVATTLIGYTIMIATIALSGPWWLTVAGWGVTITGIGYVYPRISSEPLALCRPKETGFTGSALQVAGTLSTATMTAAAALVLSSRSLLGETTAFALTFSFLVLFTMPVLWLMWKPGTPTPAAAAPHVH